MDKNTILEFGKHKGRTIEEVWTGSVQVDESDVIKSYLQELFYFLAGQRRENIIIPLSSVDPFECREELVFITEQINLFKINITKRYIIIETEEIKIIEALNKIITRCLIGNYRNVNANGYLRPFKEQNRESFKYSVNTKEFLNLQAAPSYLSWCIKSIDDFYIDPDDSEELEKMKSRYLEKIDFIVIKEDLIEYKAIFKEYEYRIPEEVIMKNQEKYENDVCLEREDDDEYDSSNYYECGSEEYGYDSWDEMAFYEAFEGDIDAWNHYNQ